MALSLFNWDIGHGEVVSHFTWPRWMYLIQIYPTVGGEKKMLHLINGKILLSGATIIAAAALVIGGTFAFFSDSETSTGNTFAAGELDLKVDNSCYYNKIADGTPNCPAIADDPATTGVDESTFVTTWIQTDLGPTHKFFYFTDVKPGDFGEDTISLHVLNNDAWGRLVIGEPVESENGCSGGEVALDPTCTSGIDGELRENTNFYIWLDQGSVPGFQNGDDTPGDDDLTEGDNIDQNAGTGPDPEPTLVTPGTLDVPGETLDIWPALALVYAGYGCSDVDGNTNYGNCHGLAQDGRMVGSAVYYFGLGWNLPDTVGNDMQGDGMSADMTFEVEQHRNNPTPFAP